MEKIIWTDCERNEILHRIKEGRNILHAIKIRKTKCFGHILRRNFLLKKVIEGKTEGSLRKQLLNEHKGKRGYWKLKEGALDHTLWRTGVGRDYGNVVREAKG